MKQAKKISGVIAADVGGFSPSGRDRNVAMAEAWTAIPAPDHGIVIALVGNIHAMRIPITFSSRTIITAGSLMPAKRTITVNVTGSGGKAWTCEQDGCGEHENGGPRQAAVGITFSRDADRRWDASYELGIPTTAAAPAISAKAPFPPSVVPRFKAGNP
ncbi:MAG: hypothetical protein EON59_01395 [Alphaproteobacteria bacterium]|nr:MAG: hypothetical protein EON59_01395 [Alphaproteobacteria bacterium]